MAVLACWATDTGRKRKGADAPYNNESEVKTMACSNPNLVRMGEGRPKFLGPYTAYAAKHRDTQRLIEAGKLIQVPCGHCEECAKNRAENWGTRCELEASYYKQSLFVTLTYDSEHLPVYNAFEKRTYRGLKNPIDFEIRGKTYERGTLCKRDLSLFLKKLNIDAVRKGYSETGKSCRYYACGEYGGKRYRPHYHVIIFGLHPPDLEVDRVSNGGKKAIIHYRSEWLTEKWGMGLTDIEEANFGSARYVAGYATKKHKDAELYEYLGIEKPYTVMSRMPGIGYQYWNDYRDEIYKEGADKIYLTGGKTVKPPKYFDRKEDELHLAEEAAEKGESTPETNEEETEESEAVTAIKKSEFMKALSEKRRMVATAKQQGPFQRTTVSPEEYLQIKHETMVKSPGYISLSRRDRIDD